ncbi:MAG: transporter substrate-binding domain-containing protein [Spirochaetales bacterium]|nr:transporter substrate-binding domain-containing protein [Spirochaetales bacterium]
MKKIYFSVFFTIFFSAFVGSQTTILIATPEWEGSTNKDGTGLYFDIVRAVFEPAGYKVDYKIMPWKRAMKSVENSQADIIVGMYYYEESSDEVPIMKTIYPKWPIYIEETAVVFKKSKFPNWAGISSLHGQTAVWPRGYNYHLFLGDIVPDWSETDNSELGLKMLEGDRMTFYIDAANDIDSAFVSLGMDRSIYRTEIIMTENLYVGFSQTARGQKLADLYDQRIQVLIKSGELKKIFEKNGVKSVDLAPRG